MWEYYRLHPTSRLAVFGKKGKKSLWLPSTWLKSSFEVWSSNMWRKRGDWGFCKGALLFLPTPALHLWAPRDSIKVDTFLLCFRHCNDCQDLQEPIGEESGPFGCVWVERSGKTYRSSFCLRGHPQTPVGDALTEMPTKLEVVSKKERQGNKM